MIPWLNLVTPVASNKPEEHLLAHTINKKNIEIHEIEEVYFPFNIISFGEDTHSHSTILLLKKL